MVDVLVTGASGFIGRRLLPILRSSGLVVDGIAREHGDVADGETWQRVPASRAVVHLAGRSFVPDSWEQPAAFLRTNLLGTINALEHCRKHGASFVYLSSYLYGHPASLPIPETAPLHATNPYASSKLLAEQACRMYAQHFGLAVTVLRVFNVYGPGQPEPFLIPLLVRQVGEGREIVVQDLEPRRDYVYVDDVAQAVAKALQTSNGLRVVNLGSGTSHSVAELVRLIQEIWRTELPVRSKNVRRKDEIMDTVADIRAARELLAWRPEHSLADGLRALRAASS
jgi:nucleoside-diphosphate-sugar epimerase